MRRCARSCANARFGPRNGKKGSSVTLDDYLSQAMKLSRLRIGVLTRAHDALRHACETDGTIRSAAQKRLAETPELPPERDHIGRWTRETLKGALPKG